MSDDFEWSEMDDSEWEGGEGPPPGFNADNSSQPVDDGDSEDEQYLIPSANNFQAEYSGEDLGGLPEEVYNAWDWLRSIDEVEAENIRGIAFADILECFDWMEEIGVLGFSDIVEIDDLFYPVIGEYEKTT